MTKKKLSNNQILLGELLNQEFTENGAYTDIESYFEFFASEQVLKNYDLSDDEIEQGIKGAGNDGGCDGIYMFLNGILVKDDVDEKIGTVKEPKLELLIIQAKTSPKFGEDAIMKWKTVSENLLQMDNDISKYETRYNEDVRDSFSTFRDLFKKLIRNRVKLTISFYYVTKGVEVHPNVLEQSEELKNIILELFPSAKINVNFYGANELMEIINRPVLQNYSLHLAENPVSLGMRKDYVALVNLVDYYHFITDGRTNELIKNIFEANIRDYQGNVAVNNEIQDTLQSGGVEDFWWLNNGITIIVSDISPQTGKILDITEPEIVNGLQTSTEIYNYFTKYPEKIHTEKRCVLVRLMVPENEAVRDKIILATNNQTAIPKSSLRSSDKIHYQIEMFFKSRGLFYDRRKNYYKNLGKKSSEIVSVSFLAQCLIAVLLHKPDYARARPSTILNNDDYYKQLYINNSNLEVFYKIASVSKKIEKYIKIEGSLSKVEKGDILFYVIYFVFAKQVHNANIKIEDISQIDIEAISKIDIITSIYKVLRIYNELGGNSKVAKGPVFIAALRSVDYAL